LSDEKNSSGIAEKGDSSYLPHVARGALINFSGILSRTLFIYVYTYLLARMLPVDQMGEYFLLVTIINLVGLAALLGLDVGIVRYVALYAGEGRYAEARKTLSVGLRVGIVAGLAFATALVWQASWISDRFLDNAPGSVTGMRIFALAVPLLVVARLFNATTQGLHEMRYQVYSRDIGEQAFKLSISAAVLILGAGLIGVIWANVTALALATALSFWYAIMLLRRRARGKTVTPRLQSESGVGADGSPAQNMLRYSYPLAISNILVALWLQSDTLLLGMLGTTEDVGYYGVAIKLALFSAKIITAFVVVFAPVIADLWNRDKVEELKQLYVTVSRWIFVLSLPVFLVLVLLSDSLMRVFGGNYVAGSIALIFLAIGQMFNAATGAAGLMVLMGGRSRLELLNVAMTLFLDVTLCVILIPRVGLMGAAIANMVSLIVVNAMRVLEVWYFMRMQAYNRGYLKPITAGAASAVTVLIAGHFMGVDTLARAVFMAGVLSIVYIAILLVLGLDRSDKEVLQMVKKRLISA